MAHVGCSTSEQPRKQQSKQLRCLPNGMLFSQCMAFRDDQMVCMPARHDLACPALPPGYASRTAPSLPAK